MFDWTPFSHRFRHGIDSWTELANSLTPLERYSLLVVKGDDAEKFLQGQCTCDFNKLNQGLRLPGAHCDHKGRMQSNFIAAQLANKAIGLRMHASLTDSALATFKKYIIFSKATIEVSEYAIIGLHGPNTQTLVKTLLDDVAGDKTLAPGMFSYQENFTLLCHDENCYELWVEKHFVNEFFQSMIDKVDVYLESDEPWQKLAIARGEAELTSDLLGELLPQEINLQAIDGVSFNKGCYTGQEIVARLHYKGKLKKHLYRGKVRTQKTMQDVPAAKTTISTIETPDKARGMVINAVQSDNNCVEFLALCDDAPVEENSAVLMGDSSLKIEWLPLPYAIS